jgi:hypothetical protein
MNPESTPIKTKPLRTQPLPSINKKTPKRGGTHPIYGVFLGGGSVGAGWDMDDARCRFSSHRRD